MKAPLFHTRSKLVSIGLLSVLLAACQSATATPAIASPEYPSGKEALSTEYPIPTDSFTRQDDFGDGYISRVPFADYQTADAETIVKALVVQWLAHYQDNSTAPGATINRYSFEKAVLLDHSLYAGYQIVAGVKFSIIPAQTPNDWGPFPGDPIDPSDDWWHLTMPVGVFRDGDYFRMRLVFGWGT